MTEIERLESAYKELLIKINAAEAAEAAWVVSGIAWDAARDARRAASDEARDAVLALDKAKPALPTQFNEDKTHD